MEKSQKVKPSIKVRVTCVIIVVLMFLMALVQGLMVSLQYLDSERVIKGATENITIKGETLENMRQGKTTNKKLAKMVTDMFKDYFGVSISDDDAEMFLKELDVSSFISKYINEFTDYLKGGGKIPRIEIDDYIDMLDDNLDVVELIIGRKVDETDYTVVKEIVKAIIDDYNQKCDQFNDANTLIMGLANESYTEVIIFLAVIMLIMLVALVVMYKFSGTGIYRAFRAASIPVTLSGIVYIIIYAFAANSASAGVNGMVMSLVAGIVKSVCTVFLFGGLSMVGAGVVLAIVAVVTGMINKKKLIDKNEQ